MAKKTVGAKYEYELKDKLGSGAFAEVYKGRNKTTGEVVAIKVIKRAFLAKYGDDIIRQIHQEVSILQSLVQAMKGQVCPFINKIFECLETSNNYYIVLEFCNQGTLLDQVKKSNKKLPEEQAVFIIFQLVQALAFLQSNNIAHRDIKPENVFIKDGIYKLGDFGFAGQKSLYQTHLGTYPYMAPEFFSSNQYDGNQVDVWALGLVFHEILFGEIYFIGNSQYEVSQKIINKPYILDVKYNCSEEVKDLLPRMVEKDRTKRITANQMMEHPAFNKCKINPIYIQIMENERIYMDNFMKQESGESPTKVQQSAEEKERLDEELRQKKLQEELNKQQEEFKQKFISQSEIIREGINQIRNGVTLLMQLCEFLQQNYIEICRYDIFYILKQSLIKMHVLKEQLDAQYVFTDKDHIKFKDVDSFIWPFFYQEKSAQQLIDDVEFDKNVIRKSYIDYFNYINNYTQTGYNEHLINLQTVTNLDLQKPVDPNLYLAQMKSTMTFFKQELQKINDEQVKIQVQKVLFWLYVAAKSEQMLSGRLIDISKFMNYCEANNIDGMRSSIQVA